MGSARENLREEAAGELRALLARRRISASELGRRLGWKQSYMARRIDGRVALDLDDLQAIAGALGTSVLELLPKSVENQEEPRPVPAASTTTPYVVLAERPARRRPDDKRPRNRKPEGPSVIRRTARTTRAA